MEEFNKYELDQLSAYTWWKKIEEMTPQERRKFIGFVFATTQMFEEVRGYKIQSTFHSAYNYTKKGRIK